MVERNFRHKVVILSSCYLEFRHVLFHADNKIRQTYLFFVQFQAAASLCQGEYYSLAFRRFRHTSVHSVEDGKSEGSV